MSAEMKRCELQCPHSETLEDLHNRLFVDNGKPCLQTRMDRIERSMQTLIWIVGVAATAFVGQFAVAIGKAVFK